jgi:hypothetical protein
MRTVLFEPMEEVNDINRALSVTHVQIAPASFRPSVSFANESLTLQVQSEAAGPGHMRMMRSVSSCPRWSIRFSSQWSYWQRCAGQSKPAWLGCHGPVPVSIVMV